MAHQTAPEIGTDVLEEDIQAFGREIFSKTQGSSPSVFQRDYWSGRVMDWAMKDEDFKVQMFRFVDVLPVLNSHESLSRHLEEYFQQPGQEFPSVLKWGIKAAGMGAIAGRVAAAAIRRNVTEMAQRFIVGTDGKEAVKVLRKLRKEPVAFTVDLLGEACVSDKEAEAYFERYFEVLESLAKETKKWNGEPVLDTAAWGDLPRVNVSVKITSLYSQLDALDFEGSVAAVKARLLALFRKAKELGAYIYLDMEHYHVKDITLQVFREVLETDELKDYPHAGIVLQAYLKETEKDARELIQWAHERGTPIGVRLVKGAYWDMETVLAQAHGWPIPVYQDKAETDLAFERITTMLLQNHEVVRMAVGSHNVRSIAYAMAVAKALSLPEGHVEFQMLYGMAEPIRKALVEMGHRVRVYAPVGEMIPGMAYLVRRLLENTSQESFLRQGFAEGVSPDELLTTPKPHSVEQYDPNAPIEGATIRNEPHTDFAVASHRASFRRELAAARRNLGRTYPLVVDGKEIMKDRTIVRENPANKEEIVGEVACASEREAELALEASRKAFGAWRDTAPEKRAEIIMEAAKIMRRRKFELAATQVLEVGKPWREADGDVAEAIDFMEYYAREMIRLGKPRLMGGHVPGEINELFYQPRGTAVVIAPWNFPQAILTGMTSAALVTGNCAIMKPAETSSITAYQVFEILREAGVPEGVLHFLPGAGEEVGAYLVDHKDTAIIAFTGSLEVGLHIVKQAAVVHPGQQRVKQVICEMGGKNAIIVDDDADLDEAVQGVVYSAFGFAGQKCSACSRVIVLEEIYDAFMERLIEAARSIKVGSPEDPASFLGPVIDETAQKRILRTIEEGKQGATLALQCDAPDGGYFVGPTIFTDVAPDHDLAQKEIFGPVLSVLKVSSFDDALRVAVHVPYALTGGVYSRSPGRIAEAHEKFRVGNLYINRGSTGALVERQPFGGFRMSGIGSKTGGPDYLLQFMEPRAVSENTMRRGFAPMDHDE